MIEVALFGAGRIGKIHAANLAAQPGVQFKYVVDVNQEAAAALAGLHGGSSATVEAALADPAIKAVVIASSTDTHADLILRSAAAGKAIFCEKPVDLTLDRARACAAAVKEAKVMCMLGFQRAAAQKGDAVGVVRQRQLRMRVAQLLAQQQFAHAEVHQQAEHQIGRQKPRPGPVKRIGAGHRSCSA